MWTEWVGGASGGWAGQRSQMADDRDETQQTAGDHTQSETQTQRYRQRDRE